MWRAASLYLLAAVALAGCAGGGAPQTVRVEPAGNPASPAAVTVPVVNGDLAAASVEASRYCRGQGRTAQLLARSETSAYYRCQ